MVFSGPDGDEQRADRRDSGGPGEQGERADDDRDRHREHSAGGHTALDRAPGQQNAKRDDGFGAQAVVQRQPERQEHPRRRPLGGGIRLDGVPEPRDHLAADHPPAGQRHQQSGKPNPDAVGADVRPQRQQVVVPAERRLRGAEPSVVVGHVAGVLGHPGHRQDVAVVGSVGADEVPPHQNGDDQHVQWPDRPPSRRKEAPVPHPVGGVQHVQGAERDHRHRQPDDHHDELQQRRGGAVARIHGGRELQARRRGPGQIGEYADDLGPEVVAAALAAQGLAGIVGVGPRDEPDEFAGDLVGVRGERQPLACRAEHLAQRRTDHRGVADDDEQVVVDPFDQQAAVDGLGRLFGHRGQQDGLAGVLRAGQPGRRGARHADGQVGGHVADQRCVDALQHAVLRPVELRGRLLDRQERGGQRQRGAEQPGDDGDEPRGAVIGSHRPVLDHGA